MPNPTRTCPHCGRTFTAKRSDAVGRSRSCRRHLAKAARDVELVAAPLVDADELDGWRRVPGGYVIPPQDPRLTFRVD